MMEHKRGPVSLDHSSMTPLTPKRLKADMPISSKEKKEKFGERIAALQQLVSPFGKTDTASVLYEAMGYINFLHEQVKVSQSDPLNVSLSLAFQLLFLLLFNSFTSNPSLIPLSSSLTSHKHDFVAFLLHCGFRC
nr:transcription factor bHLH113-like [Ipomoea batatas]